MKKMILLFLLIISSNVIASIETRSMRTQSGKIVSIGDSYISMIDKFKSTPLSSRSYDVREGSTKYTVTEYVYVVNNIYYTISIINNSIKSISWDRAS